MENKINNLIGQMHSEILILPQFLFSRSSLNSYIMSLT